MSDYEEIDLSTLSMNELIALADENGIAVKVVGSKNTRRRLTDELVRVLASGGTGPEDGFDPVRNVLVGREGAEATGVGEPQRVYREGCPPTTIGQPQRVWRGQ